MKTCGNCGHSTVPPTFCAYCSIKPNEPLNDDVVSNGCVNWCPCEESVAVTGITQTYNSFQQCETMFDAEIVINESDNEK